MRNLLARFWTWMVFAAAGRPVGKVAPAERKWKHISLAVLVGALMWVPKGDGREPERYVYTAPDGEAHFRRVPCTAEETLATAPEYVKEHLLAVTVILSTGEKRDLCWVDMGDAILVAGPMGPTVSIPFNHPNLAPATGI
jgi:hypothetical protein